MEVLILGAVIAAVGYEEYLELENLLLSASTSDLRSTSNCP
jgi:hypothetical protein